MELFADPVSVSRWSDAHRVAGHRVAVVPTMGALHAGHLSLVAEARRRADVVVVTIFVNPLQFERASDLEAYPTPIDADLAACRAAHVDAVYAPTAATMYPDGFATWVEPGPVADPLEGLHRPGHFRGVTTVVAKLLGATRPHVAVFGEKDFQQLAVVRRMVADLDMGVEIVGHPTVREPDGLAMSSRNRRLGSAERTAAACVPAALATAQRLAADGCTDVGRLLRDTEGVIDAEPLARCEYLAIVDPDTLGTLDVLDRPARALAAVWIGEVRLIDNVPLDPPR